MKFIYDLHGNSEIVRKVPVFGNGTSFVEGAAVMRGATPGTNQPFAIVAASGLVDIIGVIKEPSTSASAADDSNVGGTLLTRRKVLINPFAVFRADYDQTTVLSVTSTSGTTVTIGSLEDDIDGGWLYAVSGTGAGSVYYITTAASGSCTTKTATNWDSTTRVIKILPLFHQKVFLNTTADKLGTQAAVGSGDACILESYIETDSLGITVLDATKHSGLTGLTTLNTKFSADIIFRNHFLNTLD